MNQAIQVNALHSGRNPQGICLEATKTGDPGIYQEIRVSALIKETCVADVLVGLDDTGQLRVLVTANGDGDGDHRIAIYPQKPLKQAIDDRYQ